MEDHNPAVFTPTFAADAPVDDPARDRFDRWPFAERVARILASRQDPSSLVVGLYGAWGEGKTTVLRFIDRALSEYPHVVCVWFNPWRFRDEGLLIRSFFNALGDAVDASLGPRHEKIGPRLRDYAELLAPSSFGPGMLATSGDGGRLPLEGNVAVELKKVRSWISDLLQALGRRVVVFVDDMDRLEKETVQAVFRLVKLSADFENTIYLLSFDPKVVASSLQASGYGRTGYDFLEKIISVPLQLPPASTTSLLDLAYDGVNEAVRVAEIDLTQQQVDEFVHRFRHGFEPRLQTPRIVNQYANALLFALPILKGEVNPVDQMLVEGLRIFYPNLYEHIKENPDLYLGAPVGRDKARQQQEAAERERPLERLTRRERDAARRLIAALFPRTTGMDVRHEVARWDREQRVASERYFERYFQYAIASNDLPDRELSAFLEQAVTLSSDEVLASVRALIEKAEARTIVRKLSLRVEEVHPKAAFKLARALSKLGTSFPDTREGVVGPSLSAEAAGLVAHLLRALPSAQRFEGAAAVLSEAEPLWFALLCLSHLLGEAMQGDSTEMTDEQAMQLLKVIAVRVRERVRQEVLHLVEPEHAVALYSAWAAGCGFEETHGYLARRLTETPSEALALVKASLPRIWSAGGQYRPGSFDRQEYETLAGFVDPETVFRALDQCCAGSLESVRRGHLNDPDLTLEERTMYQFALLHRQEQKRRQDERPPAPVETTGDREGA